MLRSLSTERPPKPHVPSVERWPKKPKPIGLKRRKSVTQIGTEEIVEQIEDYIIHLERTIEDQRVFIKSLLEENRTLKLKQKIRRNIAESKESTNTPTNLHRSTNNGSPNNSKGIAYDKTNRTRPPAQFYLKKDGDMTLIERLLEPGYIITQPLSRPAPRQRHSNPALATGRNSSASRRHRAPNGSEPSRGHSQQSKQPSTRQGGETRRPADSAWVRQWLEEEADDDLWSDY